jgi:hypothetical protein
MSLLRAHALFLLLLKITYFSPKECDGWIPWLDPSLKQV